MAAEDFKRKLTAVMSADVAGYSRLMAEDEAATVKTIATYREVMASLIKQHRGRVVDSPGDNVLAEFSSVVDAVQCAVAVQKEFQARNAELPENRRMEFRIGINLGDVIDEEDRLYGSVSAKDIIDALEKQDIKIEKRMVLLKEPIKNIGTYKIPIRIYKEVEPEITVEVFPDLV